MAASALSVRIRETVPWRSDGLAGIVLVSQSVRQCPPEPFASVRSPGTESRLVTPL